MKDGDCSMLRDLISATRNLLDYNFEEGFRDFNKTDISKFENKAFLLQLFNKKLFDRISPELVEYLYVNDIDQSYFYDQEWFRAFAMIPQVISVLRSDKYSMVDPKLKPNFYQNRLNLLALHELKNTAHIFSTITNKVDWNGSSVDLELSYPGSISEYVFKILNRMNNPESLKDLTDQRTRFDLLNSFKNFNYISFLQAKDKLKLSDDVLSLNPDNNLLYLDEYCKHPDLLNSYLENINSNSFSITSYEVQLKDSIGNVHLSSLTLCLSKQFGILLAVGDRGMATEVTDYRGVEIFSVEDTPENSKAIQHLLEMINDKEYKLYSTPLEGYKRSLDNISKKCLTDIPVIPQLRNLCGFQSSIELRIFAISFFSCMHSIFNRDGESVDLDSALASSEYLTLQYNNCELSQIRLKTWQAMHQQISELGSSAPDLDTLIKELGFLARKYNIRDDNLPLVHACDETITQQYMRYLEEERYFIPLSTSLFLSKETNPYLTEDQTEYVREQMLVLYNQFAGLKQDDYASDVFKEMDRLDQKIETSILFGLDVAADSFKPIPSGIAQLRKTMPSS